MHYGIEVVTLGDYADPRPVVRLAQAAEAAGWEACAVWDHLGFVWGAPSGDALITLAAVAQATSRLRLISAITPLPRRRPHEVAHALAALDLLSGGRVIFGTGLGGVAEEYAAFGLPTEPKARAAMLDEGLTIIERLWSGETVHHQGVHYVVNGVSLAPLPVQRPRIPIWIGGESRAALRRAARWDGWVIGSVDESGQVLRTPERVAEEIAYIQAQRAGDAPFAVALTGQSQPHDARVQEYADAGVTWWLESLHGYRGDFEALMARVEAGPPR
ncbi:MAG TPA: LLM class flavin-dependent oxidoreductase [Caldilineaceae bacterium]|nr:LLM class flavin-dependent oxidoreductase [Caldilineaceae bacterium]